VQAEFHRITNLNLQQTFYAALDQHTPRMLDFYRQKAAKTEYCREDVEPHASTCSAGKSNVLDEDVFCQILVSSIRKVLALEIQGKEASFYW